MSEAMRIGLIAVVACALFGLAGEGPSARAEGQETGSPDVVQAIPDTARDRKNPVPANGDSVREGRQLFASQCAMCHGAVGDGKGDLAARLDLSVPDFTDPGHRGKRTDGELFYILTEGHGRMPGEGDRLSDTTKWHIVNSIRSMSREK